MKTIKYQIKVLDPDGKRRRFTIYVSIPTQKFVRGAWEVTITGLKRTDELRIDKIEWQLLPIGDRC